MTLLFAGATLRNLNKSLHVLSGGLGSQPHDCHPPAGDATRRPLGVHSMDFVSKNFTQPSPVRTRM
jgi:hypothetical protein